MLVCILTFLLYFCSFLVRSGIPSLGP
uniref:Uncharacterized protein n=1 Tax=Anguilla anguilla TaxID=7936 RepID=A0A0E9TYG0_ANGAN